MRVAAGATAAPRPGVLVRLRRRRAAADGQGGAAGRSLVTFIAVVARGGLPVAAAPVGQPSRSRTPQQVAAVDAPLWPASPGDFTYRGPRLRRLPGADPTARRSALALVRKGRDSSQFADPAPTPQRAAHHLAGRVADPDAGRTSSTRTVENYANVWDQINYPRLLFNTIAIALIGMIGTLVSCTLVAYGFARFRFPGRNPLFTARHRDDLPARAR